MHMMVHVDLIETFRSVSDFTHFYLECADILVAVRILETVAQPDVIKAMLCDCSYLKGLPFEFLLAFTLCHL